MNWLVPSGELTHRQKQAVTLPPHQDMLVVGPFGSGKTQTMLHRAQWLTENYHIPPARYHLFVSSNVMKAYLRSALSLLNIPETSVSTLNSWHLSFYRNYINSAVPEDQNRIPDFFAIRRAVLQTMRPTKSGNTLFDMILQPMKDMLRMTPLSKLPLYDFVLIDDNSKFDQNLLELLKLIARHVTIFSDANTGIEELLRVNWQKPFISWQLLDSFRCSPHIIKFAAELLPAGSLKDQFLSSAVDDQREKETAKIYFAESFIDERSEILATIRRRLDRGESIGILLPTEDQVYEWYDALRDPRLEIRRILNDIRGDSSNMRNDFNNGLPKIMSINSAQGLSFDTVILPGLTLNSFNNYADKAIAQTIFAGITKASKWVFLSATKGREIPLLNRLLTHTAAILKAPVEPIVTATSPEVNIGSSENDLLDLL